MIMTYAIGIPNMMKKRISGETTMHAKMILWKARRTRYWIRTERKNCFFIVSPPPAAW
jgi:hypothetical protein